MNEVGLVKWQKYRALSMRLGLIALWLMVVSPLTALAGIPEGLAWLSTQPNANGSFGGTPASLATEVRTTAEVLHAYQVLGQQGQPAYVPALSFLNNDTTSQTRFLARKILVNASAGNDVTTLVDTLVTHQNADGGFGDNSGQSSSVFDTAFALQALAAAGYSSSQQVAGAVGFLMNRQGVAGGWADGDNAESVHLTALAMRSLWFSRYTYIGVPAALTRAQTFLLSQRDAAGLWGETFNSALSLIALVPYLPDLAQVTSSIASLRAGQSANGSWNDDPYTTALALLALSLADAPQSNPDYVTIQGKVLDAQTGLPLSGVTVTIAGSISRTFTTISDGVFLFRSLPAGSYTVQLALASYATLSTVTSGQLGQTLDLGSLSLAKSQGATSGTIQGIVTDVATGAPLAGVSVSASGVATSVLTDAAGRYQIPNVPAGTITVTATLAGYSPASATSSLSAGGMLNFSPALSSGFALSLYLKGTVTAAATGMPLPGVSISVTGSTVAQATTDAQGTYQIILQSGTVTVTASLSGYDSVSAVVAAVGQTVNFSPKLYAQGTSPPDANTATITGVVLDAGTNQPLSTVAIVATYGATTKTLVSNSQGQFSLSGIANSQVHLAFSLAGYVSSSINVVLGPLETFNLGQVRLRKETVTQFLPDLAVTAVSRTAAPTDPNTLLVNGTLSADIANVGSANVHANVRILAFYDTNKNNSFDAGDVVLGSTTTPTEISVGVMTHVLIPVQGTSPFRDAPISVWLDSEQTVIETNEANNIETTAGACAVKPSTGKFVTDPNDPRNWLGATVGTFAALYFGSNTTENRQLVVNRQLLVDGIFDPTGTAPATLISAGGSGGCLGYSTGNGFDYGCSSGNVATYANAIDNLWFQTSGTIGQTVFDLGFDATKVAVFNSVDHGPLPQEAIESTVYLSNDRINWIQAVTERVWLEGYLRDKVYDGFVYVVGTGAGERFRYVSVIHGGPGALISDGDNEINGLLGLRDDLTQGIPDLTASLLRLLDNGTGQPLSLSLRVGNGGAASSPSGVVASFYQGNPAAGGLLLGTVPLATIAPGAYQDIRLDNVSLPNTAELYAMVDSTGKVSECDETNNSTQIPPVVSAVRGSIGVSTDSPAYGPNAPAQLKASVTNTGALAANFTAQLLIEDTTGAVVTRFPARTVGPLAGGESFAFTEPWNTGTTIAGNYRLRGRLYDLTASVLNEATSTFTIGAVAGPAVSLRVSTDRPVYHTTDVVNIQNLIGNVTANTVVNNAFLRITILDSLGQTLFTKEGPLGQLLPGALRDLLLPYSLQGASLAVYRIQGEVIQGSTNTILATAETRFEVRFDLNKSLIGKVEVAKPVLEIGTTQTCTDILSNQGTVAVAGLEVHSALVNVDTQQLVKDDIRQISLPAGGNDTYLRSVSTNNLTVGNYACILQARIDGALKTLAFAPFKLTEPPISIDASLKMGTKGRLLVLLDSLKACSDNDEQKAASSSGHDECKVVDSDPYGPAAAPKLSVQRAFLEKVLKAEGWSYTITESADDFTSAFHSGGYTIYALFAEREKLAETTQKELREAVYRGEGLLVAGVHDNRLNKLGPALGLRHIGQVSSAFGVTLPQGVLGLSGSFNLLPDDPALRVKRMTAESLATYVLGSAASASSLDEHDCRDADALSSKDSKSEHDECDGRPENYLDAVTLNRYGWGLAAYTGFDLLATVTRDGDEDLTAKLLKSLLSGVHPKTLTLLPGAGVPIDLTLTNHGMVTQAQITLTLPDGVTVLDLGTGSQAQASGAQPGSVTWTVTLGQQGTQTLHLWLRLPETPGTVTLNAKVEVTRNGVTRTYAEPSMTLTVPTLPTLDQLKTEARDLYLTSPADRTRLNQVLGRLDDALRESKPIKAIEEALKATDVLGGAAGTALLNLRWKIDVWLRDAAQRAYN